MILIEIPYRSFLVQIIYKNKSRGKLVKTEISINHACGLNHRLVIIKPPEGG
jgi:hypothetical protein